MIDFGSDGLCQDPPPSASCFWLGLLVKSWGDALSEKNICLPIVNDEPSCGTSWLAIYCWFEVYRDWCTITCLCRAALLKTPVKAWVRFLPRWNSSWSGSGESKSSCSNNSEIDDWSDNVTGKSTVTDTSHSNNFEVGRLIRRWLNAASKLVHSVKFSPSHVNAQYPSSATGSREAKTIGRFGSNNTWNSTVMQRWCAFHSLSGPHVDPTAFQAW